MGFGEGRSDWLAAAPAGVARRLQVAFPGHSLPCWPAVMGQPGALDQLAAKGQELSHAEHANLLLAQQLRADPHAFVWRRMP